MPRLTGKTLQTRASMSAAIPALRLKDMTPGRHPIVKLDYLVRIPVTTVAAITTYASRVERSSGLLLAVLVFYGLFWAHVAFGLASSFKDSKAAELRNLLTDCFFLGAFIAVTGFNPLIGIAFISSINAANLSLGGVRFALKGLFVSGAGALVSTAWLGFHLRLESTPLANFLASLCIAVFMSVFGFLSHAQTRRLLTARQEMLDQNAMIEKQKADVDEARLVAEEERKAAEEAREAAESASKAKSAFLANMSHELRTPLNAIIGYGELLQEEAVDAGYDDMIPDLQKICSAGTHLLRLINSVLDLSKIEAGKMDLYVETYDVAALVKEVTHTAEPLIAKNGNSFALVLASDLGMQKGDVTKLKQVLLNLIGNAGKFTTAGKITLDVKRESDIDGNWLLFSIADTGIGMKPEQLSKLFQAFTQADAATTRKYGGTGLGLVLSRRFCQMMGGNISVKSDFGKGTEFIVRLPADVANEEGDATSIHRIDSKSLVGEALRLKIEAEKKKREAMGLG